MSIGEMETRGGGDSTACGESSENSTLSGAIHPIDEIHFFLQLDRFVVVAHKIVHPARETRGLEARARPAPAVM